MTVQIQLPVPVEYEPGHTPVFFPQAQAKFLDNLSINGNVRHACKVARVSPQTAYRARRQSPALAALWDAALLSARDRAEEELATRAMKGTEESVFYHGEEVATRIRYDSRLLLAHLARLDRLAERAEVSAALHEFDDAVDALGRGEELPKILPQDSVPSVPSCRETPEEPPLSGGAGAGGENTPSSGGVVGGANLLSSSGAVGGTNLPSGATPKPRPVCPDCGGRCDDPGAELTRADCQWLGNRLTRMERARPRHAPRLGHQAQGVDEIGRIEALQLEAFEAGGAAWWLVTTDDEMEQSIIDGDTCETAGDGDDDGAGDGGCDDGGDAGEGDAGEGDDDDAP